MSYTHIAILTWEYHRQGMTISQAARAIRQSEIYPEIYHHLRVIAANAKIGRKASKEVGRGRLEMLVKIFWPNWDEVGSLEMPAEKPINGNAVPKPNYFNWQKAYDAYKKGMDAREAAKHTGYEQERVKHFMKAFEAHDRKMSMRAAAEYSGLGRRSIQTMWKALSKCS